MAEAQAMHAKGHKSKDTPSKEIGKTFEALCMNPKCKMPLLAYGEGFHEIGDEACAFYSSETRFCCISCEMSCSDIVYATINVAEKSNFETVLQPEKSQTTTAVDQAELRDTTNTEIFPDSQVNVNPKWTNPEVLQLLILHKANDEKFHDPKWKKKAVWEEISKQMKKHGFLRSASNCEVKFKNLKQKYVKTIDHNNKSGNDLKTCSYFNELNEIFACNPFVKPVAECSNRKGYTKGEDNKMENSNNTANNEVESDGQKKITSKQEKKKKRSIGESLTKVQDDLKEENKKKMLKLEEMHREKMERFDRLLNLYEKDLSMQSKKD